jgi:ATP-dependent Zn protease
MPTWREQVAYHEAGHAVVTFRLGIEVLEVSIVPYRHGNAGSCTHGPLFTTGRSDDANLIRAIQISLGGPVAERRFHPQSFRKRGSRSDYDCAAGLARYLVGPGGEPEFLRYYERLTRELIERHWHDVERVAAALLKYGILSAEQFRYWTEGLLKEEDAIDRERWEAICNPEPEAEPEEA